MDSKVFCPCFFLLSTKTIIGLIDNTRGRRKRRFLWSQKTMIPWVVGKNGESLSFCIDVKGDGGENWDTRGWGFVVDGILAGVRSRHKTPNWRDLCRICDLGNDIVRSSVRPEISRFQWDSYGYGVRVDGISRSRMGSRVHDIEIHVDTTVRVEGSTKCSYTRCVW